MPKQLNGAPCNLSPELFLFSDRSTSKLVCSPESNLVFFPIPLQYQIQIVRQWFQHRPECTAFVVSGHCVGGGELGSLHSTGTCCSLRGFSRSLKLPCWGSFIYLSLCVPSQLNFWWRLRFSCWFFPVSVQQLDQWQDSDIQHTPHIVDWRALQRCIYCEEGAQPNEDCCSPDDRVIVCHCWAARAAHPSCLCSHGVQISTSDLENHFFEWFYSEVRHVYVCINFSFFSSLVFPPGVQASEQFTRSSHQNQAHPSGSGWNYYIQACSILHWLTR